LWQLPSVDIVVFGKGWILDYPQVVHKDLLAMKLGGDVSNLALTNGRGCATWPRHGALVRPAMPAIIAGFPENES
jgi:hypothetical protein